MNTARLDPLPELGTDTLCGGAFWAELMKGATHKHVNTPSVRACLQRKTGTPQQRAAHRRSHLCSGAFVTANPTVEEIEAELGFPKCDIDGS